MRIAAHQILLFVNIFKFIFRFCGETYVAFVNYLQHLVVKSAFPSVLLDIWPVCTVNIPLMKAVLKMLVVYTADCPKGTHHRSFGETAMLYLFLSWTFRLHAILFILFTAQVSITIPVKQRNCLYHGILKIASNLFSRHKTFVLSKQSSPHIQSLILILQLLANCVICKECRGIIKKVSHCIHLSYTIPAIQFIKFSFIYRLVFFLSSCRVVLLFPTPKKVKRPLCIRLELK